MTRQVITHNLGFTCKIILLIICITSIVMQYQKINKIVSPFSGENLQIVQIKNDLKFLSVKGEEVNKLSKAIKYASDITNISDIIITSVMCSESRFNLFARSPKTRSGYYEGLMQTPKAYYEHDLDTIKGAKILEDKLRISNGKLDLALALYKGGNNPEAWKHAKICLNIIDQLKERRKYGRLKT